MNRVVLIGDSIRMGYEETVRRELSDVAEVLSPEANGGTSERVLANLDSWALELDPGVLHINCGLHDLKKDFGASQNAVPLADYERNVREILTRAKAGFGGTLIWAQTTPVNEVWHHERKGFDRFEADVNAYNDVARRVAEGQGVLIDDLYAVVMKVGRDVVVSPDGVHFGEAGRELLGKAVAGCIRPHLKAV